MTGFILKAILNLGDFLVDSLVLVYGLLLA